MEAVRDALFEEMRRDPTVLVMGEDVACRGGVFLATDGLVEEFGPERVIDTPLAESSIAGIALGASVNAMRVVAEIEFGDFVWPAVNQIVGEASRVRYGTNGTRSAPMVVRIPYGGEVRGGLYHSQTIEIVFAHQPGLIVIAPSTPYDAKGLLKAAIRSDDPVVFLEHKRTYRLARGEVPDEDYTLPIGVADVKRAGSDLTIVTHGLMVHYSLAAAGMLAEEGVEAELVDLRTLTPLDRETVLESVRKTGKVMIVHEDSLTYGAGAEIAAIVAAEAFEDLDAPVLRVAAPDLPEMPFSPALEAQYMPSPQKIADKMRELAAY